MPFVWSDEKIEELKFNHAAGLSMADSAALLGTTRNAVIGKAHRLGLVSQPKQDDPSAKDERTRLRNDRRALAQRMRRREQGRPERRVSNSAATPDTPMPVALPAPVIVSIKIPFAELRPFLAKSPNQCRFIAAEVPSPDYLACGTETLPGQSWCEDCKSIVFYRGMNLSDTERARRQTHGRKFGSTPQVIRTSDLEDEAA